MANIAIFKKAKQMKLTKMIKNKENAFLILLIFLFICIHIGSLTKSGYGDELYPYKMSGSDVFIKEIILGNDLGHTPFYIWPNYIASKIFGIHTWVFRSVSLLFSTGVLILIFFITKELYGKKQAIFSAILFIFSCWYYIFSTQLHIDAPFLNFFMLLCIYSFIKYDKITEPDKKSNKLKTEKKANKNTAWLILCGAALGLAMLTKMTGFIALIIIIIYIICQKKSRIFDKKVFFNAIKHAAIIIFIAAIIFLPYVISSLLNPEINNPINALTELNKNYLITGESQNNITLVLIQYFLFLILLSPFFIFTILNTISDKKEIKKHIFLLLWAIFIFLFYTFVFKGYTKSFERYFLFLLIPLIIISSDILVNLNLKKKQMIAIGVAFIFFLTMFSILNMNSEIIPFYPKTAYIEKLKNLDLNVAVPINGNAGPIGFYISLAMVICSYFLVIILAFIYILSKYINSKKENSARKKETNQSRTIIEKIGIISLIFILGISFAYNINLILEDSLKMTSPDVDMATKKVQEYLEQNKDTLSKPTFVFRNAVLYMDIKKMNPDAKILDFGQDTIEQIKEMQKGAVLIIVDFPKTNYLFNISDYSSNCKIEYEFSDKNIPLSRVINCQSS